MWRWKAANQGNVYSTTFFWMSLLLNEFKSDLKKSQHHKKVAAKFPVMRSLTSWAAETNWHWGGRSCCTSSVLHQMWLKGLMSSESVWCCYSALLAAADLPHGRITAARSDQTKLFSNTFSNWTPRLGWKQAEPAEEEQRRRSSCFETFLIFYSNMQTDKYKSVLTIISTDRQEESETLQEASDHRNWSR